MIRVAIVDDEIEATDHLRTLLMRYAQDANVQFQISTYDNGVVFLEGCRTNHYDLVFMDVDMPDMDGFQTARNWRQADSTAVLMFVTNVAQQAIRGYEVNALDYILKPLSYQAFCLKMPKALAICNRNNQNKIAIKTRTGQSVFSASSIIFVGSDGHHITYYTEQGEIAAYGTMKNVDELLPKSSFFRCNSGYIVNLGAVTSCEGNVLVMNNGTKLEISRARRKEFLEALQRFYFSGGN